MAPFVLPLPRRFVLLCRHGSRRYCPPPLAWCHCPRGGAGDARLRRDAAQGEAGESDVCLLLAGLLWLYRPGHLSRTPGCPGPATPNQPGTPQPVRGHAEGTANRRQKQAKSARPQTGRATAAAATSAGSQRRWCRRMKAESKLWPVRSRLLCGQLSCRGGAVFINHH